MCEDACSLCRRCGIIGKTGPAMGRTLARANTINGPFVNGPYMKPRFCRRGDSRIARKDQSEVCAMELPKRKQIRLSDHDYSSPGAYFVTICTHEKRCFLSEITVGAIHESPAVHLTDAGVIVQGILSYLPQRYSNLTVDHSVIMPNHIHLLLRITEDRAIRESPLREDGRRSLLDKAVGFLKMNSSREIHTLFPDLSVWQRSYHEHVIRSEADYREIWEYIDTNPARWSEDRYYAP